MLKFEDLYPSYTASGFSCTNEDTTIHSKLLKGERIGNALAIASAGEVALFNLLPKVRGNLICVDHSYRSLGIFCIKVMLLQECGAYYLKNLLSTASGDYIRLKFDECAKKLPAPLAQNYEKLIALVPRYGSENHPISNNIINNDVRNRWNSVPIKVLKVSAAKLHKLHLIHGDITDAIKYGPFTHVYLSNAFEHMPRGGGQYLGAQATKLAEQLGKNCKIYLTRNTNSGLPPNTWKELKTQPRTKGTSSVEWSYHLYAQPSSVHVTPKHYYTTPPRSLLPKGIRA